jgi:SprT protein
MTADKLHPLLVTRVPDAAISYCLTLWQKLPFDFKLRKTRQTKVGDFTFRPGKQIQITVNRDLHPYLFLMTYIHEVAHHHVHAAYGHRIQSHGTEWKRKFQELMAPLLNEEIFPEPILSHLKKHMLDPMASSFSDSELTRLFRSYDQNEKQKIVLSQLPEGSIFSLNKRWFRKGKVRRTRVLCSEIKTKRQYLIPLDSLVGEAQLSFL